MELLSRSRVCSFTVSTLESLDRVLSFKNLSHFIHVNSVKVIDVKDNLEVFTDARTFLFVTKFILRSFTKCKVNNIEYTILMSELN